ncbi:MAG: nucleic acid-binding protein [Anaerolineae bacterium]|nr:nucleic acid-binding protein [Anaerolineae bacterium]
MPTVGAELSLTFYLDASALVKRYMVEAGTAWVETLCADEDKHAVAIAQIGLVEVAAAFAAKQRGQFITPVEHDHALANLVHDALQRYQLVIVNQTVVDSAIQLTRRQRLRGYDAVHLACALALNTPLVNNGLLPLTFVSADNDLLAAATAEGLATDNPNHHP